MEATSARILAGRSVRLAGQPVGFATRLAVICIAALVSLPSPTMGQFVPSPAATVPASAPSGVVNQPAYSNGQLQSGILPYSGSPQTMHVANRGPNLVTVPAENSDLTNRGIPAAPIAGRFQGQHYVTRNFVVQASSPALAQQIGEDAEHYRAQLAKQWLGRTLPDWQTPCPIQVLITRQAEGETSFLLPDDGRGLPSDWNMIVKGPVDRVRDSVLPHEITHTIFATHFRQRLPRWIDEGACTTVEHPVEKQKIHSMLIDFLSPTSRRGLPFNRMFLMREYPAEMLPLYAQGFSVAKYLIAQGGHQNFTRFVERGLTYENQLHGIPAWTRAVQESYQYDDLSELQLAWLDWVQQGSHKEIAEQRYASLQLSDNQSAGHATLAGLNQPESMVSLPSQVSTTQPSSNNASDTNVYQRIFNGQGNQTATPNSSQHSETSANLDGPVVAARANSLRADPTSSNMSSSVRQDLPLMERIPGRSPSSLQETTPNSLRPSDTTLLPIRRGVLR